MHVVHSVGFAMGVGDGWSFNKLLAISSDQISMRPSATSLLSSIWAQKQQGSGR